MTDGKATAELSNGRQPEPPEGGADGGSRPTKAKASEYTRGWMHGLIVGVLSGATLAALGLLITVNGTVAALQERVSTLEDNHPADLEKRVSTLEGSHPADLIELKCELYDQALDMFDDNCTDGGGQFTAGICNYPELRNGRRTVRFRPPIQGLGRLCGERRRP